VQKLYRLLRIWVRCESGSQRIGPAPAFLLLVLAAAIFATAVQDTAPALNYAVPENLFARATAGLLLPDGLPWAGEQPWNQAGGGSVSTPGAIPDGAIPGSVIILAFDSDFDSDFDHRWAVIPHVNVFDPWFHLVVSSGAPKLESPPVNDTAPDNPRASEQIFSGRWSRLHIALPVRFGPEWWTLLVLGIVLATAAGRPQSQLTARSVAFQRDMDNCWPNRSGLVSGGMITASVTPLASGIVGTLGLLAVAVFLLIIATALAIYGLYRSWRLRRSAQDALNLLKGIIVRDFQKTWPFSGADPIQELPSAVKRVGAEMESELDRLRMEVEQLRFLYEATEQFNDKLSLDEAISLTIDTIWRAANVDYVVVLLGEGELGPYRYAGARGVDNPLALLGQSCDLPLWGVLAQTVVHKPEPGEPDYLVIHDIAAEDRPKSEEFPWIPRHGSLMILPLRSNGKAFGAVLLGTRQPRYLDKPDLSGYLSTIVARAAKAVQDAQSQEQTTRWINQLVSLQLFTQTITETQDIGEILLALGSELQGLFGEASVHVFLQESTDARFENPDTAPEGMAVTSVTDYGMRLDIYTVSQFMIDDEQLIRSPKLLRLVNWVLEAGQPIFYEPSEPIVDPTDLFYRDRGHALLVPIASSEEGAPLGVIHVSATERVKPFYESDMIVMRTVSNSVATAIGNARLYRQLLHVRYQGAKLIAQTVDARLGRAHGHSIRVADNAEKVAHRMGLSSQQVRTIGIGGALHELNRTSGASLLSSIAEYNRLNGKGAGDGPVGGDSLAFLQGMGFDSDVIEIVTSYAALMDPQGTVTDNIGAHIVAAVDLLDRTFWQQQSALGTIDIESGLEQFDARAGRLDANVVTVVRSLLRSGALLIPDTRPPTAQTENTPAVSTFLEDVESEPGQATPLHELDRHSGQEA
jgi:GAF domain-containing protein